MRSRRTLRCLPGMQPTDVTFEIALKLLSLPRTLGDHPEIERADRRVQRQVRAVHQVRQRNPFAAEGISPIDVTLEQAVELLAQPKQRGRGRAAPREPLKTFENSPVTNQPVKLLDGRFGNYVTDGTTNATLPKDYTPESLTFQQALDLLAERAARGPATPRGRRGKAPKAAAAPEKSGEEKSPPASERPLLQ